MPGTTFGNLRKRGVKMSAVWEYFEPSTDKNKITCKKCSTSISSCGTSSLKYHATRCQSLILKDNPFLSKNQIEELDCDIRAFIVENLLPFSTIESIRFRNLFKLINVIVIIIIIFTF